MLHISAANLLDAIMLAGQDSSYAIMRVGRSSLSLAPFLTDLFSKFVGSYDAAKTRYELIRPLEMYWDLVGIEAVTDGVMSSLEEQANDFLLNPSNQAVVQLDSAEAALSDLEDQISVTELYLGSLGDKYTYRVHPSLSTSKLRKTLPSHVKTLEKLKAAAIEIQKGTLASSAKGLQETANAVITALPDTKDNEVKVTLKSAVSDVVNTLKINASSENAKSKPKVSSVVATLSDGSEVEVMSTSLKLNNTIPLLPTKAKSLTVTVKGADPSAITLSEAGLFKATYLNKGIIAEQAIVAPRPIQSISILEEDLGLSEKLQPYFTVRHEVSVDRSTWHRLRARNRDYERSDVPELLVFGASSLGRLPGAKVIPSRSNSNTLFFKSTFEQNQEIPIDVLGQVYAGRSERKYVSELLKSNILMSGEQEVQLEKPVFGDVSVKKIVGWPVAEKYEDLAVLGKHDGSLTAYLPQSLMKYITANRVQLYLGSTKLTLVSSATPSSGEYKITSEGLIVIGDTASGKTVRGGITPEPNYVLARSLTNNECQLTCDPPGDLSGLQLFYYTKPESSKITYDFQDLTRTHENSYSIDLKVTGVTASPLLKAYDGSGNEITSSVFANENTFVNGLENSSSGNYSVDLERGRLHFYKPNGVNLNTLTIEAEVLTSEKRLESNWSIERHLITIQPASLIRLKQTIPAGANSLDLSLPSSKFQIISNSISIPGYSQDNEDGPSMEHVDGAVLEQESNDGTYSYFNLPFGPVNSSHGITVTKGGVSAGTASAVSSSQIKVEDPSGTTTHVSASYAYNKSGNQGTANTFSVNYKTGQVLLSQATTSEVEITYVAHSYSAEYDVAIPVPKTEYSLVNPTTFKIKTGSESKEISRRSKQIESNIILSYEQQMTNLHVVDDPSRQGNVISLIPQFIDLEVHLA